MSFFRRRRQTPVHPAYLFTPSVGGLLTFGAILGGVYFLWPMMGFNTHPYVTSQVTSSNTIGFDAEPVATMPATLNVTTIRSVYDGDTFRIESVELVSENGEGIPVRVRGVDSAELDGACRRERLLAQASRQWLIERLNRAEAISLTNVKADEDPYGRIVADVEIDGSLLSEQMIEAGAARDWTGRQRSWCE